MCINGHTLTHAHKQASSSSQQYAPDVDMLLHTVKLFLGMLRFAPRVCYITHLTLSSQILASWSTD